MMTDGRMRDFQAPPQSPTDRDGNHSVVPRGVMVQCLYLVYFIAQAGHCDFTEINQQLISRKAQNSSSSFKFCYSVIHEVLTTGNGL